METDPDQMPGGGDENPDEGMPGEPTPDQGGDMPETGSVGVPVPGETGTG